MKIGKKEKLRFSLFRLADYVVSNAYSQEEFIKNFFPRLKRKTITISNFVDLEQFHYVKHERKQIPEILVVASIWTSKNTSGLIDAVKILRDRGCKFHISWYGKSEMWTNYLNECQRKIDQYALQPYITLLDKTKEILTVYQQADFFCLPSFFEGTPNVICEALASGLPIICSNICDNARYVREGENGFLFDPYNSNDMADKLQMALNISSDWYQFYCKKSRDIAVELLSKETFLNKYMNLLNSL